MADKHSTQTCGTQLKTYLLGSVAIISTVAAVVLSQPHSAVASLKEDACFVEDHSELAAFAPDSLISNNSNLENPLFWNTLTKSWLTDEQTQLLHSAYEIGFEDGGHEHAEVLQAVLLQETIAGQLGRIGHMTARVGKRSYGVMQVKVSAARDVLKKHKHFGRFRSDEELIVALMTDDEFNMRIASKFLLFLGKKTDSVEAALVAYNIGLRASRKIADPNNFKYVVRTQRNLKEVVQHFNQKFIPASDIHVAMR